MKTLIPLLLLASALLIGCASADATRTGKYYPPTDPKSVEIVLEKPTREYEVVGYISGTGGKLNSDGDVFEAMREEAAKLGADAVLVRTELDKKISGWNQYGPIETKEGKALAIRWK